MRLFLDRVRERKRLKEEAKQAEVLAREMKLKEDIQENAGKIVKFKFTLTKRPLPSINTGQTTESTNQDGLVDTERILTPIETKKSGRAGPSSQSPIRNNGRDSKKVVKNSRKSSPAKTVVKGKPKSNDITTTITPVKQRRQPVISEVTETSMSPEEAECKVCEDALAAFDRENEVSEIEQESMYKEAAINFITHRLQIQ